MKIISYLLTLAIFVQVIYNLPIILSSSSSVILSSNASLTSTDEDNHHLSSSSTQCPTTEYSIVVEHFAQLIATHWQFDHLEPIISNTYRTIAEQFQKHIQITTQKLDRDTTQQHLFRVKVSSDDRMDLDILHAQIFGAIQAHTEGNLPLAWDRL